MPVYDFSCENDHIIEVRCSIADREKERICEECGLPIHQIHLTFPAMPTTIIVDYPGSKKHKAGYVHSHGDHMATKTQFGYGGGQAPKEVTNPFAKGAMPDPFHFRKFK